MNSESCSGGTHRKTNPRLWWESLLDELKAHHVPGLHPHGKRMSVDLSAQGTVRTVVHFTASTVSMDEAIAILKNRGIEVHDQRRSD